MSLCRTLLEAGDGLDTYYNADLSGPNSANPNYFRPRFEVVRDLFPAVYAAAAPVLALDGHLGIPPALVDAYVLPRTALAILFAALLFGGGLVFGRRGAVGLRMGAAAALVGAAALLAWAFSTDQSLSWTGAYLRYESVVVRLAYLGLFCGAAWLAAPRATRWAARAFIGGSSVAAAVAIYQWGSHSAFRPDGNLGQAGLLGALLAMATPIALGAGLRGRPWLLTVPVLGAGLAVSTSRAGWLGAVVAVFVLLALMAPSGRTRLGLLGAGVVTAGLALTALVASPLRTLNSDTGSARLGVWGDALRMAASRPLTGWGEDATGLVFGRFMSRDWEPGNAFDRVHDQPLDLLVTQGLIGLLAALAMWLLFWAGAWRAVDEGRVGAEVAGLLGAVAGYQCWALLNFDWAPATGPVFLLAGLAWGSLAGPPKAVITSGQDRPLPGKVAWPVAAALAMAGGWLAVAPVVADAAHYRGEQRTATRLDPLQAHYHQALGRQLGSSTPAALGELKRAFELGDYDYPFCVELGDAALRAGDRALARAAYRRAEDVYPFDPTARIRLQAMGPG